MANSMLLELPLEMLFEIGKFLLVQDITRLCRVCHLTHQIFADSIVPHLAQESSHALHVAIRQREITAVENLLNYVENVNAVDWGLTPLMLAVEMRYFDAVELLLRYQSIDLEFRNQNGETATSIAVRRGSDLILRLLLKKSQIYVNNLFEVALLNRQYYIFETLLSAPHTDLNDRDHFGQTLLHHAVEDAHYVAVQMLLTRDEVDINVLTSEGDSALLLAMKFYEYGESRAEELQVLHLLLSNANINLNQQDTEGRSALWHAMASNDEDVILSLAACKDIDLSLPDQHGLQPLARAAEVCSYFTFSRFLRQTRLNANANSPAEVPPLWAACRRGNDPVVDLLLKEKSILLTQRGPGGSTSLEVALHFQHYQIARRILDRMGKADINCRNLSSQTYLMLVAANGISEMVWRILQHPDIDINACDNRGRTSLWYAAAGGHLGSVGLLADHRGTNIEIKDNEGMTALDVAKKRHQQEIQGLYGQICDCLQSK